MQLRRCCVSQVSEPLALYWTMRGADREFWHRWPLLKAAPERIGVYRWDGERWRKQAYTLVHGGMEKTWLDEPELPKSA